MEISDRQETLRAIIGLAQRRLSSPLETNIGDGQQ